MDDREHRDGGCPDSARSRDMRIWARMRFSGTTTRYEKTDSCGDKFAVRKHFHHVAGIDQAPLEF
jgi:hypothetical protein